MDLRQHVTDFSLLLSTLDEAFYRSVERVTSLISEAFANGGKILVFGNGGSSADASHFAAEFVGRYQCERRALPAISLSAETASITAIGNDYGYDRVFERQIEAFGNAGDIAIGLTTSGKSANILRALKYAAAHDMKTVAFVGAAGLLEPCAEVIVAVPSLKTFEIQEVHKMALHSICADVERSIVARG